MERCPIDSKFSRSRVRLAPIFTASLVIAGCSVGPRYKAPEHKAPDTWSALREDGIGVCTASPAPEGLARWWTNFNDPVLSSLIDRAIEANPDLRVAAARVLEARSLRGVAKAAGVPVVNAGGEYRRSQGSETNDGARFAGVGEQQDLYRVGLDASWEIDVFGGIRRNTEAAEADIAVAEESRRDVLVSLLADVAENYATLRGFQRRLAVASASVKVQEESLSLARARAEAGLSSELEVAQAAAILETRRSQIPPLNSGLKQAAHRVAVLLGKHPGELNSELLTGEESAIPPPPPEVPVGLPSDLLKRRPDVRRAEREIAAASARIGVETAELYPRFSLTGSFGFESGRTSDLFEWKSRSWSIGPSVRWNLFSGSAVRARIAAAGAREQQALARYDKAVLESFEEVENRLTSFGMERSRRESLRAAVEANTRALDYSRQLYSAGIRDFLNVLDSQRSLYDAQDALVQSDLAVTTNLIALYKALGGGWEGERVRGEHASR